MPVVERENEKLDKVLNGRIKDFQIPNFRRFQMQ